MSDRTSLGNFLKFNNGQSSPVRVEDGKYKVFGSNGIIGHADSFNTAGPCIIIGRVGSYCGSVHFSDNDCWVTDNAISTQVLGEDPAIFWYEFLRNCNLRSLAHGSGQPLITQRVLKEIQAPHFSAKEKIAIGEFLSALEQKIACNNQSLSIANSFLRNWYSTLSLSPDTTLSDTCALINKSVQPSKFNSSAMYIALEHFDSTSMWIARHAELESANSTKSEFKEGDTLFGKLRPYFHKVGIAPQDGICSTDILVLRPNKPEWKGLVLAAANSDAVVDTAVQNSNGTRMPRAKWTDIADCPVPDPEASETTQFMELTDSLVPKCNQLIKENEALAKTRDELLPLLMNGTITVGDVAAEA
ncbi:restriction endonuclease subunit S [uncultured Corynebacterium sp.]|uniref:restriction endonuclease subunit S n=1 Tax=uncultured Corynebacterium sp. TaxID=159447 RepID=UPI0025F077A9|nr:restriction endonuclease subunit S [uncultured Corynebacterium sp.]